MFYQRLHECFLNLAKENGLLAKTVTFQTKILKTTEAIGNPGRQDYPLLKGKEFLMEATFMEVKGQAYTDAPSEFSGTLNDIVQLSLANTKQRALFIATLNAVMRFLFPDLKTIHCKNNEPEECADEIVKFVQRTTSGNVGLLGLQPAFLEALVKTFGAAGVSCVDRDEDFRGEVKYGVPIIWGEDQALLELFERADLVLATGSTIINGSLEGILQLA
ncbi:MAG: DUF364 domain-containing protein, partial [Desulfuromonadaceae bacterium]